MTLSDAFKQVKAFARIDGVFMAVLRAASFMAIIFDPQSVWGTMLAIATPFVAGARLKVFRDRALDGVISFRRGYAYLWYTFLYASLLFAAFQLVYFRFFDNGAFVGMLVGALQTIEAIYRQQNLSVRELQEAVNTLRATSDVQLVFTFFTQNITFCAIMSLPVAAIMRRSYAPYNK